MAQDVEPRLREYLASAPQKIYPMRVVSFSHSAMSKTWHLWREGVAGTVRTEAGEMVEVLCANVEVEVAGTPANLDQQFQIALDTTDIDDLFREELDRIPLDTEEYMRVMYREYLSDDLLNPMAVVALEALSVSFQVGSAGIMAYAPRYNVSRTGELYEPRVIPMLRAFFL